jgi:AraC-like DNA-binding protein
MVNPALPVSQQPWSSVPSSNPFDRHLQPLNHCLLDDWVGELPLPLQQWRHHPAGFTVPSPRAFQLRSQPLQLVALVGPEASLELAAAPARSLVLVNAGEVCFVQQQQRCCAAAGSCLLLPRRPGRWVSGAFSVVCVLLPEQALARQPGQTLEHPRCCAASQGEVEAVLLGLLDQTLRSLSLLQGAHPSLLGRLGLAEQINRLSAILSSPELGRGSGAEPLGRAGGQGGNAFEDLMAYIRANLDQPLNLTLLESRSNYSRRALQYAFRERLGCTPTQWIRAQRLDLAYDRLKHAGAGDSVTAIAQACGYRSMGLFSIEFQQRFHIKPSLLLREARLNAPG